MMLVTKASDACWLDFETETDIIKLYEKYGSIIIERDFWENEDLITVARFYKTSLENAQKIIKCNYRILIYDDYIE